MTARAIRCLRILVLAALFCGIPLARQQAGATAAAERILSFDSHIVIAPDAALTVTETITALSTGGSIRHGIVREFPTRYNGRGGRSVTVGFRVLSVTCDGHDEDYHIKDASNGKMIFMGKKNALLPPGRHTYVLTYHTDGQIGQFADYDELYWNVTGNGWQLPIDSATATVTLPPGAQVERYAAYTGPTGAKGHDFTAQNEHGAMTFSTTAPLPPGQGLTVAVAFPKGFVHTPSPGTRMLASPAFRVATAGLVAVLVYFLIAWGMVGRDPRQGILTPLFTPPADLSAPATRYVRRMGFDDKTFAAGVVQMAVEGGLTIGDTGKTFVLARGKTVFPAGSWQHSVAEELFGSADSLELEQTNHTRLKAAGKRLRAFLASTCQGRYFHANRAYFFVGAVLSAGVMALTALRADDPAKAGVFIPWLTAWTFAVALMTLRARTALRRARSRPRITTIFGALFLSLFALPFWIGEAVGVAFLSMALSVPAALALAAIGVANAAFWHLLKAPTLEGRRVMDGIEGFRLYLSVGEKDRLNLLTPSDRTVALFERYLPYALALGVENAWAAQFRDTLEQAAVAGQVPVWYVGRTWNSDTVSDFAGGFGDAFSSAIAAASTPPGSSSGSGGGGSSGGGGGGGGGGGW